MENAIEIVFGAYYSIIQKVTDLHIFNVSTAFS